MGMISFLKQNKVEAKKVEEVVKSMEEPKAEEVVKAEVVEVKPVEEVAEAVTSTGETAEELSGKSVACEEPAAEEEVKPRRRRRS